VKIETRLTAQHSAMTLVDLQVLLQVEQASGDIRSVTSITTLSVE